jgi:hypothetical protein
MGGVFSGRNEYAATPHDRDCLKLDVDEFSDILEPGTRKGGAYSWSTGAEIYWETLEDAEDEALQLTYEVGWGDGEKQEKQYPIWIQRTECNFGGTRPWWSCPRCGERVGKLYLPPGEYEFRCRHCHDFGYTSSRASGCDDRTLRLRYNRIRKKLGAEPCHPNSMEAGIPDRPKGMHEETYYDLIRELREANDEWLEKAFLIPMREHFGDRPEVDV